MTAARDAALTSGDPARRERWEGEVVALRTSMGSLAEEWTRAYWLLYKELGALRQVMDAYWASQAHAGRGGGVVGL